MERQGLAADLVSKQTNTATAIRDGGRHVVSRRGGTKNPRLLGKAGAPRGSQCLPGPAGLIVGIEANSEAVPAAAGREQPRGAASPAWALSQAAGGFRGDGSAPAAQGVVATSSRRQADEFL